MFKVSKMRQIRTTTAARVVVLRIMINWLLFETLVQSRRARGAAEVWEGYAE